MNILAYDTCIGACSVAVAAGTGTASARVIRRFELMDKGQAERLMPMISEALANAGLEMSSIDRIAATTGPGTFTGTRISVASARALLLTTPVPFVAFSSLEVIAHNPLIVAGTSRSDIIVATNANRGEAYVQVFDAERREKISKPLLVLASDCAGAFSRRSCIVAGTAAETVTNALLKAGIDALCGPVALQPDAGDIIGLVASREPLALSPRPLYLRPPDAKPQDGKSIARTP